MRGTQIEDLATSSLWLCSYQSLQMFSEGIGTQRNTEGFSWGSFIFHVRLVDEVDVSCLYNSAGYSSGWVNWQNVSETDKHNQNFNSYQIALL